MNDDYNSDWSESLRNSTNLPNVPLTGSEQHKKLDIEKIPNHIVMKKGGNFSHVVHEDDVKDDMISKGEAICGAETQNQKKETRLLIRETCKHCLRQLNQKLKNTLYDSEKEEHYLPDGEL